MKYKVQKSCVIGGQSRQAGEVIEIDSAEELKALMGIGRVLPHDEPVTKDRSVGLSQEDKPRRRGRAKKAD